ncbi:MAG: hypothetical protein KKA56_17855, partial [Gammaproteobacteria bacterium]|nr:hypothetical protein [Gammaproteobacteria bacterium]
MLQHYQQQVASGLLRYDENQWQVLQQMSALAQAIDGVGNNVLVGATNSAGDSSRLQGLYIYGPV